MVSPSPVTPIFTLEQYQQLLALFGNSGSPFVSFIQGQDPLETTMANVVSSNSSAMAGMPLTQYFLHKWLIGRHMTPTWVIDTGATDHIVCLVHLLITITANTMSIVQLPNGETTSVTHVRTVTLSSSLVLHDVLCVPFFAFNLFSVSSFTKSKPFCLVLLSEVCFIQDLTYWRTIGVGHTVEGLYLIQCGTSQQPSATAFLDFLATHRLSNVFHPFLTALSTSSLSSLQHARLGHPSDAKLQALGHSFPFWKIHIMMFVKSVHWLNRSICLFPSIISSMLVLLI